MRISIHDGTFSKVLVLVVALLPVLVRLVYYPKYPGTDDAFIHASIIEMIMNHHTWGINPGVNVNLSTSPLFTVFFAVVRYFLGDAIYPGIVMSAAAVVALLFLTYYMARKLAGDSMSALAVMALVATNIHLWRWAGTFMETSFACLTVVLILVLALIIRQETKGWSWDVLLGVVLGLSMLVRPEIGLLYAALFVHDLLNRKKKILRTYLRMGCGLAVMLTMYMVISWLIFGYPLPSTYYAKTSSQLNFVNPTVFKQLVTVVGSGTIGVIIIIIVSVSSLFVRHKKKNQQEVGLLFQGAVFLLFPSLGFMFYYLKMPMMESPARYFLPFLITIPFVIIPIAKHSKSLLLWDKLRWAFLGAILLQSVFALHMNHTRVAPVLARMWDEYVATMTEASEQIRTQCDNTDIVLVAYDIGVVSWRLNGACRIADGAALGSPELRGMSLVEKIKKSNATYLLQSLGTTDEYLTMGDSVQLKPVWERSFKSHGVDLANQIYHTRLYKIVSTHAAARLAQ